MANNFDAARALADAMGAPQPTPAGRDMAQQIAVAFNAYAGSGVVDVTRPDEVPPGVNLGVKADFWKDPTFQKGAMVAGIALLILWWQSRRDRD